MPQMFDWIFYAIVLIPCAYAVLDLMRTPKTGHTHHHHTDTVPRA